MAREPSRGFPSEREEVRPPGRADESNAVPSLLGTLGMRSWAPSGAPVPGLESPGTRRTLIGSDYVVWAPGAHTTPHSTGPGKALYPEPASSRRLRCQGSRSPGNPAYLEGAVGTLCAHSRPIPLATLQNAVFRLFRAFPQFPAFLTDSGGPSLPL